MIKFLFLERSKNFENSTFIDNLYLLSIEKKSNIIISKEWKDKFEKIYVLYKYNIELNFKNMKISIEIFELISSNILLCKKFSLTS